MSEISFPFRSHLSRVAVLVALGLAVYANAIFHPFVHDDVVFIQNNSRLSEWSDVSSIFLRPAVDLGPSAPQGPMALGANSYYRPLLDIFYKAEHSLVGLNPHGYHLINIILHVLNTILVYAVLVLGLGAGTLAFGAALLFAIHPVQTEAVACIAGISNVLFVFLALSSILLYILSREKRAGRCSVAVYGGSLVLFTAALLAKEQAIVLPLLILLYDLCYPSQQRWTPLNRVLRLAGYFFVASGYLACRTIILGSSAIPSGQEGELILRLLAIPGLILEFWGILLWPAGLHYYRSVNILEPFTASLIGFLAAAAALTFLIARLPVTQRRLAIFGLGWFFVALLPTINIVPLIYEYSWVSAAEHFLYLPSVGFFVFVLGFGGFYFKILGQQQGKRMMGLIFAAVLLLACLSIRQNTFWRGEIPLFERTLKFERLGRVHILLAKAYYFDGQYDKAIFEFEKAESIMEGYAQKTQDSQAKKFYLGFLKGIYFDLAHCYEAKGDLLTAVSAYQAAVVIDPRDSVVRNNLALAYLRLGRRQEAVAQWKEAVLINPNDTMAVTNLAVYYMQEGNTAQARQLLRQAIAIDSNFTPARAALQQLENSVPQQ